MKRIVAILMLCIGGAAVIFMIPGWFERIHLEQKTHSRSAKSFRRNLAEGVRIGRHGAYGGDFVRCGKCFLGKMRKGVLTFGGLNVLVLEDLKVVVPLRKPRMRMPSPKESRRGKSRVGWAWTIRSSGRGAWDSVFPACASSDWNLRIWRERTSFRSFPHLGGKVT